MEQAGGEHGARVPRGDDRVGVAVGDASDGGDETRVGLRAHRLGRLLRHLDPVGRLDEREAARVETRRAVEHE